MGEGGRFGVSCASGICQLSVPTRVGTDSSVISVNESGGVCPIPWCAEAHLTGLTRTLGTASQQNSQK
jgi:hypothetical protein